MKPFPDSIFQLLLKMANEGNTDAQDAMKYLADGQAREAKARERGRKTQYEEDHPKPTKRYEPEYPYYATGQPMPSNADENGFARY